MLLFETVFHTFSFIVILWIVSAIVISRWIIAYVLLMLARGLVALFKPIVRFAVQGTNVVADMLMGNE